MKNESTYKKLMSDPKMREKVQEEEFILDVTEKLIELMEDRGITRSQLAKDLGTSRSFISQILNGDRNMTLRTLFRLARALDYDIHWNFRKHESERKNVARAGLGRVS